MPPDSGGWTGDDPSRAVVGAAKHGTVPAFRMNTHEHGLSCCSAPLNRRSSVYTNPPSDRSCRRHTSVSSERDWIRAKHEDPRHRGLLLAGSHCNCRHPFAIGRKTEEDMWASNTRPC